MLDILTKIDINIAYCETWTNCNATEFYIFEMFSIKRTQMKKKNPLNPVTRNLWAGSFICPKNMDFFLDLNSEPI